MQSFEQYCEENGIKPDYVVERYKKSRTITKISAVISLIFFVSGAVVILLKPEIYAVGLLLGLTGIVTFIFAKIASLALRSSSGYIFKNTDKAFNNIAVYEHDYTEEEAKKLYRLNFLFAVLGSVIMVVFFVVVFYALRLAPEVENIYVYDYIFSHNYQSASEIIMLLLIFNLTAVFVFTMIIMVLMLDEIKTNLKKRLRGMQAENRVFALLMKIYKDVYERGIYKITIFKGIDASIYGGYRKRVTGSLIPKDKFYGGDVDLLIKIENLVNHEIVVTACEIKSYDIFKERKNRKAEEKRRKLLAKMEKQIEQLSEVLDAFPNAVKKSILVIVNTGKEEVKVSNLNGKRKYYVSLRSPYLKEYLMKCINK